jgi:hypothetical protein
MKTVLKSIFGGIAIGALLFFAGPSIFIVLLLKFIFTPFGMGRMVYARHLAYGGYFMGGPHFTDKVRSMSEEEYNNFKTSMQNRYYGC